jgi:hypothetical protein
MINILFKIFKTQLKMKGLKKNIRNVGVVTLIVTGDPAPTTFDACSCKKDDIHISLTNYNIRCDVQDRRFTYRCKRT